MSNLMMALLIGAGIVAVFVVVRIFQEKQRQKEEREDRERMDNTLNGIGAMTSGCPMDPKHFPYSASDKTSDD